MTVFVWDMIRKFKVMSVGGAYYSHDAIEPGVGKAPGSHDAVKRKMLSGESGKRTTFGSADASP